MYVGYSLRLCVRDIIEDKVPLDQVEKLITNTAIDSPEAMDEVMKFYKERDWAKAPEEAERIARLLFAQDKVEQPRLAAQGGHYGLTHIWWERDGEPFPTR